MSLFRSLRLRAALLSCLLLSAAGCREELPDPSSERYRETVSAFYTGLTALQAGDDSRAGRQLERVTALAPAEPAAWANLGLLALRRQDFEAAAERLERARALAPENSRILLLLGLLASTQGDSEAAIEHFRRAAEADSANLRAAYLLTQEIERRGGAGTDEEATRLLTDLLRRRPDNLALRLELLRLAAKRGDAAGLRAGLAALEAQAAGWPPEAQEQLAALRAAAAGPDPRAAGPRVAFLRNVLVRVPDYARSLAAVSIPVGEVGQPIERFLKLPSPDPRPAPADDALRFEPEPAGPDTTLGRALVFYPDGERPPALLLAGTRALRLPDGAVLPLPGALPIHGVAGADLDSDFRTDLVLAGPGGVRLYRQQPAGGFEDATAATGLPASALSAATGVWAADVDLEGDLDLVLGRRGGPPLLLRNNGDGTFALLTPFSTGEALRDFAWADLDADGDPDAALVDGAGRLHLFSNERGGLFRPWTLPEPPGPALAAAAADADADGVLDLLLLGVDGSIERLSPAGGAWRRERLAAAGGAGAGEDARLLVADLDNNGGLDLVASGAQGTRVWLRTPEATFQPLEAALPARVTGAADLDGDGRLDLAGSGADGRPVRLLNRGTQSYHWQVVRPRAASAVGDQRINSFGLGGEMELRAGLLYQKQPIAAPLVHFGLGEREQAEVVRIVWPNGSVQGEFELAADQVVRTEQRLKGSCPWLFAWDGERFGFVTDFIWRSPLGLMINAQESAGVAQTEDRVLITGSQLRPRDGFYELRITAELWETHFFDHLELRVLDHPASTELRIDERFVFPPPDLSPRLFRATRPVRAAADHAGRDVTELVAARDGRYLGGFRPGRFQGVAEDHFVELDLEDAPAEGPLYLVGFGWVRPTDSSINVALGQGTHPAPMGLSLEVIGADGRWKTARAGLGFPAGKHKTVLLDLAGLFEPGAPRRLRLRTNLEVYWDALGWAVEAAGEPVREQRLRAETAELRHRGYSVTAEADRTSPELPEYDRLAGTGRRWRDLEGYYTRFGPVEELVERVDDRYVIMNAGDEIVVRFRAPGEPPAGWVRDFVLVGDGWVKDGDLNTVYSRTVLPLPYHGQQAYGPAPARLEDDPVHRRHAADWQRYHTRYVHPESFHTALRPVIANR